jgi:hypothetical protein
MLPRICRIGNEGYLPEAYVPRYSNMEEAEEGDRNQYLASTVSTMGMSLFLHSIRYEKANRLLIAAIYETTTTVDTAFHLVPGRVMWASANNARGISERYFIERERCKLTSRLDSGPFGVLDSLSRKTPIGGPLLEWLYWLGRRPVAGHGGIVPIRQYHCSLLGNWQTRQTTSQLPGACQSANTSLYLLSRLAHGFP